ncbi:MAG: dUTP diphosphatase [Actinomycetota bacterium]
MTLEVLVKRIDQGLAMPRYAHAFDAGLDLFAACDVSMKPFERALIATGISVAIPAGYAGYVQPRSGLAISEGLGILNSPGLIDAGYRAEIKVIAINLDPNRVIDVKRGDKIAQLMILAVPEVALREVESLPSSERGQSGFGSTGR